jgi:hypothetical protein
MTRSQLRRLFLRHYGESAKIARDLKVNRTTISKWFQGRVDSRRIDQAIRKRATELVHARQATDCPVKAA